MLRAIVRGDQILVPWDRREQQRVFTGMMQSLACFLAGPGWLLLIAALFWLNSGELTLFDQILVGELVTVAAVYWVFSLLAVVSDESLAGVNPLRVVAVMRWSGLRTVAVVVVVAGGGTVLHGWWAWHVLTTVQESTFGWAALLICFLSVQVCSIYLLNWLGLRCFLIRKQEQMKKAHAVSRDQLSPSPQREPGSTNPHH